MDYLTQHYKNLSEQLQAKVNHLKQLMEAEVETKVAPGSGMEPAKTIEKEKKKTLKEPVDEPREPINVDPS